MKPEDNRNELNWAIGSMPKITLTFPSVVTVEEFFELMERLDGLRDMLDTKTAKVEPIVVPIEKKSTLQSSYEKFIKRAG